LFIAESIFKKSVNPSDEPRDVSTDFSPLLRSHHLYHGHIVDPEKGRTLDEVLLSIMLAPHTYTKENVVEINTHSGHVVLSSILDLVLRTGARLAEPGEFTKRAYINGRIDLTQAEAVIDIINSRTDKALEIATSQIKGFLKERIESIRGSLFDTLTDIEAAIDFPDDVGEIIKTDKVHDVLEEQVVGDLNELLEQYESGHILRDGLKMVIVGRPNVGKSSLLNRLIQEDRAIVTSIPGTTRDLIEETLNIRGIPVIIADTAGLHETNHPVEVIGIAKTKEYINGSDLILFMVDSSRTLTGEDERIFELIDNKPYILVVNKSDLVDDNFELETPELWKSFPSVKISALYGSGLSDLKDLIEKVSVVEHRIEFQNTIVPNLRHKKAIERSLRLSKSAIKEIREGTPSELVAIDIQEAIDSLGEIIGMTTKEDVIDQIFTRFCIGK